jgi:hypothetical protein
MARIFGNTGKPEEEADPPTKQARYNKTQTT